MDKTDTDPEVLKKATEELLTSAQKLGEIVYKKAQEEAAKKELWLQLVEARQAAGLTQQQLAKRLGVSQAQVARVEKRGYDAYTLTSLRRYVNALGKGFSLKVIIEEQRMYSINN